MASKKEISKEEVKRVENHEERLKAIEKVMSDIEKSFGKGSIMRLGKSVNQEIEVIPSGSITLNRALGVGGYPKGRIVEIYGPESSGKTTLALTAAAETQKLGGTVAIIDAEHALDPTYAKALGVNIDDIIISQPDSGEMALEIAEALIRSAAIDLLIVDSVAALVPRAEIDGEMGDSHIGLQARLMSQGLRKIVGVVQKNNCVVIFINQLREKVGVMFGNPEVTTGGRALKFYASIRLDVRKGDMLKEGDNAVGALTKVKVMKNKVSPPFKTAEFNIMYGSGIDNIGELLDISVKEGIVSKSGAWYNYGEERLGQGKMNVINYLKENVATYEKIENETYDKIGIKKISTTEEKNNN
ncbi:MAG: Protein RecA [uncultured Clostridium sp.]